MIKTDTAYIIIDKFLLSRILIKIRYYYISILLGDLMIQDIKIENI